MASKAVETVKNFRKIEDILPAQWSEEIVVANGIRQHYYRTGGGKPALLLLHGFLDGSLTWLRTARALQQDYDVIMLDTRGHGLSEGIASGYSYELLVEDVASAIDALKLDAPRIIGHSQGAAVGIQVAATYPDRVSALLVEGWSDSDTTSTPDFVNSPGYRAWFNTYLAWLEQLKTQTHEQRMISALSEVGNLLLPEEEYVAWVENCARLDLELVRHSMSMWAEAGATGQKMKEALARVVCPALIMKSGFFPQPGEVVSVREEESEQPNVRIVHLENTGHLVHSEQFDAFITVVKDFLAQTA